MARRRNEDPEEIEVRVGRIGGEVKTILLNGERSIEDALDAAGVDYSENSRIRVNGETVNLDDDYELEDGDRVTISGKIKGGC